MARERFLGSIPDDRLYDPEFDMWVQVAGSDFLIGASSFGLFLAGEIIAFTSKPKGAEVSLGRGMATVESAKTVLAVHAPISFVLLQGNDVLEERPSTINQDPYVAGWMGRVQATAWELEQARLVPAQAYRDHIRRLDARAQFL